MISTDVENAGIDDIDALVRLRLAYLTEDHGVLGLEETAIIQNKLPDYFHAHLGKDLFAYVIRQGQEIVSCAFLLVIEKPLSPAFPTGRTGIVLNVYTCPCARRKGYARKIMCGLLDEATKKELSVVELKSTDAGFLLYRSVGFSPDHSKYHPMKWINPEVSEDPDPQG